MLYESLTLEKCHFISCFRLTAFVLKSFAQASDYIFIDNEVMQKATQTLIVNQNQDGSFNNTGFVRTKYMQVIKQDFMNVYCGLNMIYE